MTSSASRSRGWAGCGLVAVWGRCQWRHLPSFPHESRIRQERVNMPHLATFGDPGADDWIVDEWARTGPEAQDPTRALGYTVSRVRQEHAAIMSVLDQAVDHLTPAEITMELAARGVTLHPGVVAQRLKALQETFLAVSGQPDNEIERWQELNGARWRYTATACGRQVQRLWTVLSAEGMVQREVALDGLARIREALTALQGEDVAPQEVAKWAGQVFVEHDQLDASLVGQTDMLARLADRFDLGAEGTGELKQLIVEYATHVVVHLDREVAAVHGLLMRLRPRFTLLAAGCGAQSRAGALVARGVLAPSRGTQSGDWEQLLSWFAPASGRAWRFGQQLVRAIPMMHANLQRQQSVVGPGTLRAKALSLAAACRDGERGRRCSGRRWRTGRGRSCIPARRARAARSSPGMRGRGCPLWRCCAPVVRAVRGGRSRRGVNVGRRPGRWRASGSGSKRRGGRRRPRSWPGCFR
ncbi:hypothetical protein BN2537_37 [Streptomyces venezuelae]|nr:hypothetical protein BN2537_37 [Streptomyces venezuelae]